MDASRSARVVFSLWEYGTTRPHPRDIYELPQSKSIWFPMTVSDSIMVLYEFPDTAQRDAFMESPPASFDAADISIMEQPFYDKWAPSFV